MPFVSSSAISRLEWSEGTLSIWFRSSNQQYDYFGVPEDVYRKFLAAPSKGKFYDLHIKDKF